MPSSGLFGRERDRGKGRGQGQPRRKMRVEDEQVPSVGGCADANGDMCSCGSAFCCSGKLLDFQQYVERLYWSNPFPEPLEEMEVVPTRLAGFEPARSLLREISDAVYNDKVGKENEIGEVDGEKNLEETNKRSDKVVAASRDNYEEKNVEDEGGNLGDVENETEKVEDQEGKGLESGHPVEVANINSYENTKNVKIGGPRHVSFPRRPTRDVLLCSSPPPLLEKLTNASDPILKVPEDGYLQNEDDGLRVKPPDLQHESDNDDEDNYYLYNSMCYNSFDNLDPIASQPPSPIYMGDMVNSARSFEELPVPTLFPIHGIPGVKQEIMTDDEDGAESSSGGDLVDKEERSEEENRDSPLEELMELDLEIPCFSSASPMPTLVAEAPLAIQKTHTQSSPSHALPSRTRSMQYQCSTPSCGKRFARREALLSHEKEHNLGDQRPFCCKVCNRSYSSKSSFESHLSRHRVCRKCGHQLKNAPIAKKATVTSMQEFCDSCWCKYSKAMLLKHLKKNEDSSSDEIEDEDTSKSESPLKKRRRVSDSPIKDSEDNISTEIEDDDEDDMNTNVSERDEDEEEEEKDEDEAGDGTEVNGHSPGYQCTDCDRVFAREKWYKLHVLEHQKTQWPCEICNELMISKNALRKHMRTHPSSRKFKCQVCGDRFRMQHHLNNHMSIHNVKREFTCAICGKCFGSYNNLKTHQTLNAVCSNKLKTKAVGRRPNMKYT